MTKSIGPLLILSVAIFVLLPSALIAHPGHGSHGDSGSVEHYLFEPIHFAQGVAVAVLLGLAGLATFVWRAKRSSGKEVEPSRMG